MNKKILTLGLIAALTVGQVVSVYASKEQIQAEKLQRQQISSS